jgi:hypothetical protein
MDCSEKNSLTILIYLTAWCTDTLEKVGVFQVVKKCVTINKTQ